MVFDSRFAELRDHFQIQKPEDWQSVKPEFVTALPNIGPQTLNHLRLHLANEGLTLAGDETPAFWQSHLSVMRGTSQIANNQNAVVTPFTVLIDKAEQQPFTFAGIRSDAANQHRPLLVMTEFAHLGPSHGDYTIKGLERHVHVERKSQSDVQGTVLGWGDRREQFQKTLEFLAEIPSSAIIVECEEWTAIETLVSRGKKSKQEMQKIFSRQVDAWRDDYRVPWIFCRSRRMAEMKTFRWLSRYWRHHQAKLKQSNKQSTPQAQPDLTFPGI
ncbi:MAG: hypothetical protein ACF788_05815 [Novipirellula sp. JB048]